MADAQLPADPLQPAPEPEPEAAHPTQQEMVMPRVEDYGLPKDHPYTPPELRVASELALRSEEDYAKLGGKLWRAGAECFRTYAGDTDPIVASFDDVLTEEEVEMIVSISKPKVTRPSRMLRLCGHGVI
eukprot:SAG11_NODE_343_length_10455_cov_7.072036_8_plen_129_part_00